MSLAYVIVDVFADTPASIYRQARGHLREETSSWTSDTFLRTWAAASFGSCRLAARVVGEGQA